VFPKATEQPTDAGRYEHGPQRPLAEELLAGTHGAVDCVAALLAAFRGGFAHLPKFLLGRVPDGLAHFLKVVSHFLGLFAKLITCGSHYVFLSPERL
jgi:hypothetical protein